MGQQVPAPGPLTVGQAIQRALKNYPSVRVSQEQINAAAAGIRLARTAYLPHADALAQVNRATRNNVFGLLLPQSAIPSISGPVLGTNNFGTTWGTALGVLVTWEPFDFGLRRANLAVASALEAESEAALKRTEYEIAVATADACLTLAAAQETIRAAQAGVDRAGVLLRTITAQVNAQLRPGADASRADAELAAARTQWIQAQQAADVARATLSQFVGMEPGQITLDVSALASIAAGTGRPRPGSREESRRAGAERRGRRDSGAGSGRWNAPTFHASICRVPRTRAARARRPTAKYSAASMASRPARRTTPSGSP